ncbi:hypothetical protein HRbin17_01616 [bacterium HR17]|jgi:uncharacterized protein YlxW (UPF0749 family)|uniref:DUF881 domain-containing protein n=1 Tax=Candidatus Fervidibacter japonicus TaxID=2035412 RepID=A0A2H5XD48_9BACT|nr:hypothetical protein HRbin17_01616 [bacterium HR17]
MRSASQWEQRFAVVAICFTLGLLIAVQVRTLSSQQAPQGARAVVLIDRLASAQDEIRHLRQEVDKLREQLRNYEQAMAEGRSITERLTAELQRLRVLAGLTRVRGPGIIVRVTDAPKPSIGDPSFGIVHDTDLLMIVNELRNAGAEAIAINDQRIVATTAIRCVGSLITVNGATISPPYEVVAIGDPDKLLKALTMPKGIVDDLQAAGIPVTISQHKDVIVPSLSVTPPLQFARPIE